MKNYYSADTGRLLIAGYINRAMPDIDKASSTKVQTMASELKGQLSEFLRNGEPSSPWVMK